MATVFTMIIDGDLPGRFVWKDERCVAFLSINPLSPGHTLVVPREPIDHWLDLPEDLRSHLFNVAHSIGRAIESAWNPQKVGLIIAGLEVPHAHIHVSAVNAERDLDFSNAAADPDPSSLDDAAQRIRQTLRTQGHEAVAD
ncbi:MAG: HIT family protein [Acidimicrobiia bacterium]|nr:HIT family protein [Acidimicrobiia bacterium]